MPEYFPITKGAFDYFKNASDKINKAIGTPLRVPKKTTGENITLIQITGIIETGTPVAYSGFAVIRGADGNPIPTGDGRVWGAGELTLRHCRNDILEVNTVVKATLTSGEDGDIWIAEYETRQTSFRCVGDVDGNDTLSADGFEMTLGGFAFSNYGSVLLDNLVEDPANPPAKIPIFIPTESICYASIEFLKDGQGGFAIGAGLLNVVTIVNLPPYRQEDENRIVVNVPIAEVKKFNIKLGFLWTYQTNDLLIDLTQQGSSYTFDTIPVPVVEPTPFTIDADRKWLNIRGKNLIYHDRISKAQADAGIGDACNWMEFLALSTDFACAEITVDDTSLATIKSSVESYINGTLVANLLRFLIDSTGHIPKVSECDGTGGEDYPVVPVDSDITIPPVTSDLTFDLTITSGGTEVETDDLIATEAHIQDAGASFTDFDGVYKIRYTITIGGNSISFDDDGVGAKAFFLDKLINQYSVAPDKSGNLQDVYCDLDCFYNKTATIKAVVVGSALSDTVTFTTEIVTMTISADKAIVKNGDTVTIEFVLKDSALAQFTDFDGDGIHESLITMTWQSSGLPVKAKDGTILSNADVTEFDTGKSGAIFVSDIEVLAENENDVIVITGSIYNSVKKCYVCIEGTLSINAIPMPVILPANVALFDGASSLSAGNNFNLGTGGGTIELWFKTPFPASNEFLFFKGGSTDTSTYSCYLDNAGGDIGIHFNCTPSGTNRYDWSKGGVLDDGWHCAVWAMGRSSNKPQVTLDGVDVTGSLFDANSAGDVSIGSVSNSGIFAVGKRDFAGSPLYYNEAMGFMRIWVGTDLSVAQRAELYNGGVAISNAQLSTKAPSVPTPTSGWDMANWDAGSTGNELVDGFGGNNLTKTGTVVYTETGLNVDT